MGTEAGRELAAVHGRLAEAETELHEARRKAASQQQQAMKVGFCFHEAHLSSLPDQTIDGDFVPRWFWKA